MVRICREKNGRRSHENVEDGSDWTTKDQKTETEVERCYARRHEGDRSTET